MSSNSSSLRVFLEATNILTAKVHHHGLGIAQMFFKSWQRRVSICNRLQFPPHLFLFLSRAPMILNLYTSHFTPQLRTYWCLLLLRDPRRPVQETVPIMLHGHMEDQIHHRLSTILWCSDTSDVAESFSTLSRNACINTSNILTWLKYALF